VNQTKLQNWLIEYDQDLTRQMYREGAIASAETCSCDDCAYYARNRKRAFPKWFLEFLESVGIDYAKEAEVYAIDNSAPGGPKSYHGWFHLIGRVLSDDGGTVPIGENDFQVIVLDKKDLAPEDWLQYPIIQIEFSTTLS